MTTNKRFTFMQDTLVKADVFDNGEFVCCTLSVWVEQLVDLLNELHEENEQSKMMIATLRNIVLDQEDLEQENKEIKTILTQLVNQLYNSQLSLIHEYSTDIDNDEKELKKYFQDQYGKYGWKK